jgi:hypothetical protein
MHYKQGAWVQVPSGLTMTVDLYAVWGSATNDVFAMGDSGTILHWDGMQWNGVNSGTTSFLISAWGSAPLNIWAVGQGGALIHH